MSEAVSKKEGSFISPVWDFVFVGGLSFVLLPIFIVLDVSPLVFGVVLVAIYVSTFFNDNPHFMYSYQLMYENFREKIGARNTLYSRMRYIFSGIIVPILLIGFYVYSYLHGLESESVLMFGYAINILIFFVGWHYVKQGYGVLLAFSAKKRMYLRNVEKKILLYNSYAVWVAAWMFSNRHSAIELSEDFFIPYTPIHVPFDGSLLVIAALLSTLMVLVLFIKRFFAKNIAWNGWVGYLCAVYLWMLILYLDKGVFLMIVPPLHSLQYLLFIGKISFEKRRDPVDNKAKGFLGFIAVGGILGVISLWMVPVSLDLFVPYDREIFGPTLFMMMFVVFISIHHYFIDFAIWRKDNPDMKYLYK